jgi:hypothetical protein
VAVLEGYPVEANGNIIPILGAAQLVRAMNIHISTDGNAELLLVDVSITAPVMPPALCPRKNALLPQRRSPGLNSLNLL